MRKYSTLKKFTVIHQIQQNSNYSGKFPNGNGFSFFPCEEKTKQSETYVDNLLVKFLRSSGWSDPTALTIKLSIVNTTIIQKAKYPKIIKSIL